MRKSIVESHSTIRQVTQLTRLVKLPTSKDLTPQLLAQIHPKYHRVDAFIQNVAVVSRWYTGGNIRPEPVHSQACYLAATTMTPSTRFDEVVQKLVLRP